MKKLIAGLLLLVPAFTFAKPICPSENIMFSGTLESQAGSQRLCLDKSTDTWVFGTRDDTDKRFYYTLVDNVETFNYVDTNTGESLKGYKVSISNDLIILAVNLLDDKIKASFITLNKDQVQPFNVRTVKFKN